jgi:hypothetical protein
LLQYLKLIGALLRGAREVTSKSQERLGPFEATESTRDLLSDLDHPDVTLTEVVIVIPISE